MDVAWMAWTWQTALLFAFLALTLAIMTVLAVRRPETPRFGVLNVPTTRGDRLFISLLAAAFLHLAWIGTVGADTIATVPIADGLEISGLWLATLISLAMAAAVFRWV
jgi:predicted small integral membrane protein